MIDFDDGLKGEELIVGEKVRSTCSGSLLDTEAGQVFGLPEDPHLEGYAIRWPIYAGRFNTRDYKSRQNALDDVESIWRHTIKEKLGIHTFQVSNTFVLSF